MKLNMSSPPSEVRKRGHRLRAFAAAYPCLASLCCCSDGSVSPSPESPYSLEIIAPERARVGESLPVVVRATDGEGRLDPRVNAEHRISTEEGIEPIALRRGLGSASLVARDNGEGRLSLDLAGASRVVSIPDSIPLLEYTGQLQPGRPCMGPVQRPLRRRASGCPRHSHPVHRRRDAHPPRSPGQYHRSRPLALPGDAAAPHRVPGQGAEQALGRYRGERGNRRIRPYLLRRRRSGPRESLRPLEQSARPHGSKGGGRPHGLLLP